MSARVGVRKCSLGLQVATLGENGGIRFSDVYAFGHKDPHTDSDFIRLSLAGDSRHTLELTSGHFIPTGTSPSTLFALQFSALLMLLLCHGWSRSHSPALDVVQSLALQAEELCREGRQGGQQARSRHA